VYSITAKGRRTLAAWLAEPGGGPVVEFAAITLTGKFITDLADMLDRWAAWASGVVEGWPDDPGRADADWDTLRAIARRPVQPATLPGP